MAPTGSVADDDQLLDLYSRAAVEAGFVGDADLSAHLANAAVFEVALPADGPILDLGSGAGLPGLLLARRSSTRRIVLLDASARRCRFLEHWAAQLAPGTEVVQGRAEVLARSPELAGVFAAVVARAFGRPAVTAECAVGFLRVSGRLLVSEPPDSTGERWPEEGLSRLGLQAVERVSGGSTTIQVIERVEVVERYPRSDGVPAQRPLF